MSTNYRKDIDGLRSVAVLFVLAYHGFPDSFRGGFIGVDMFFVISGFLITGIILEDLEQNTFSFWNFYQRRIKRLFPALFLVLASALVAGWFVLFPDEYSMLGKHTLAGTTFISNIVFWQEAGYWDVAGKAKPLLHLWSLGIEEQFYLLFPLLLVFVYKKKFRLLTVILGIFFVSFAYNIHFYRSEPVMAFYSPAARFWELLMGSLLAVMASSSCSQIRTHFNIHVRERLNGFLGILLFERGRRLKENTVNDILSLFGIVLLAIALGTSQVDYKFPGYQALLPTFGVLLIVASGPQAWINRTLFSNRIAVAIGLISYPLYLWHWPLLSYAYILGGELTGTWEWRWIRLACIFFSFILAAITYRMIERPMRFGKTRQASKIILLLLLMLSVGIFGAYVFFQDGLPKRKGIAEEFIMKQFAQLQEPGHNEAGFTYAPSLRDKGVYCSLSNMNSKQTVAVIGDSHARQIYPAIAQKNSKNGINTFLCSWSPQFKYRNEMTEPVLASKNDITHVFIVTRGVLYTEKDNDTGLDEYITMNEFKETYQHVITLLRQQGKKVFIIAENPVLHADIKNYIIRPFALNTPPPGPTRQSELKLRGKYLSTLKSLSDATVIETLDVFCPTSDCILYNSSGESLYLDDDHLSTAGNTFLVDNLLQQYLPLGRE